MKLFGRSGGYYLFWISVVYFCVGMYLAFNHADHAEYGSLGYVLALSVPLWCPPVARYFNMEPLMFDLFKRNKMPKNVVPFPTPKAVAPVEPPEPKEKDPTIHYTIGHTNDNRIAFRMGYTTLTMNHIGVQQLIDQLELYKNQLHQDEE